MSVTHLDDVGAGARMIQQQHVVVRHVLVGQQYVSQSRGEQLLALCAAVGSVRWNVIILHVVNKNMWLFN